MKIEKKTQTIMLFILLIIIGGLVLYRNKEPSKTNPNTPPQIKGPTMPPPDYATQR